MLVSRGPGSIPTGQLARGFDRQIEAAAGRLHHLPAGLFIAHGRIELAAGLARLGHAQHHAPGKAQAIAHKDPLLVHAIQAQVLAQLARLDGFVNLKTAVTRPSRSPAAGSAGWLDQ